MRLDCEIISQDFLPVLRAALAKELAAGGMNQKDVAQILGISQPAVSQYLRDLRGAKNHFVSDKELFSRLQDVCGKIKMKELDEVQLKKEMYILCETAMNRSRNLNN
jgi:predicted transcriptional regulator